MPSNQELPHLEGNEWIHRGLDNLIKRIKRAAFRFYNFANYRILAILRREAQSGHPPIGKSLLKSEEPLIL